MRTRSSRAPDDGRGELGAVRERRLEGGPQPAGFAAERFASDGLLVAADVPVQGRHVRDSDMSVGASVSAPELAARVRARWALRCPEQLVAMSLEQWAERGLVVELLPGRFVLSDLGREVAEGLLAAPGERIRISAGEMSAEGIALAGSGWVGEPGPGPLERDGVPV